MRKWKWAALAVSGGILMQMSACATDFAYYLLQVAANQLVTGALTGTTA